MVEVLDEPVVATVEEGPLPRWATVIEARQRVLAHVVVEADRAGADLTAFDGGDVLTTQTVEGSTLYIHRGHPGGWFQPRFQHRAENTWKDNAHQVADAVADLVRKVDAVLVAVSGDIRAQTFILESLPAEEVRAGLANGTASTDSDAVMDALRDGRVARLLVHDDGTPGDQTAPTSSDGARLVDRAIDAALATDAEILVVPHLAMMDGPLAATMRW